VQAGATVSNAAESIVLSPWDATNVQVADRRARSRHCIFFRNTMNGDNPVELPPAPPDGQIIVHGEVAAPKRKRIKLLNRTPSPVILDDYGDLEPSRCTVGGPGVAGGTVGLPTQVNVTARDANGIGIREGGESFVLTFQHSSIGSTVKTYHSMDKGDGTYAFSGIRADLKGMHKVGPSCRACELRKLCVQNHVC
jgi:hypothetical protein